MAITNKYFIEKLMVEAGVKKIERHGIDNIIHNNKEKMMELLLLGGHVFKIPGEGELYDGVVYNNTLHIFEKDFWA